VSSILIVGPSWVGDMMMAQSLFKLLKMKQPNINIDVLTPTWSEGLLQRMDEVRHIIPHTIPHGKFGWRERRQIGQQLRSRAYQQAIVLPNSWKSALIPYFANIPQRTGFKGEMRYGLLNDIRSKKGLTRTVDQFVALGTKDNAIAPQPSLSPKPIKHENQQPILALCPGAEYGPAKCWPLEYYATVAKQKRDQGWQVWIFGSHKDYAAGAKIQSLVGEGVRNLCGQTSLSEAVDLLALTNIVITNDSGLMHIAAALDKPVIAIYGSSSPKMTPPLSDKAHIISLGLNCSPCYQRTCPKKHLKCLRDITPDQVFDIMKLI
jgi:heptosyltransferase-2